MRCETSKFMQMFFSLSLPASYEIGGEMESALIFRVMCHGRRRGSPTRVGGLGLRSLALVLLPLCEILGLRGLRCRRRLSLLPSVCRVTMTNSIVSSHSLDTRSLPNGTGRRRRHVAREGEDITRLCVMPWKLECRRRARLHSATPRSDL